VPGHMERLGQPPDEFLRLIKQVEALMQLVVGLPMGVRAA
jgi:hypothetical protein